ncbi:MAG TPA: GNAT family N-acetyltransferase [Polyangiaceae bacterium]
MLRRPLEAMDLTVLSSRLKPSPRAPVATEGLVTLTSEEVVRRSSTGTLPSTWRMRVGDAGILTLGLEELVLRRGTPNVGDAVAVVSGGRIAFRRVVGKKNGRLRLRADIAPFEEDWEGDVVAVVEPRLFDRIVALAPDRLLRLGWLGAMGAAHAKLARKRALRPRPKTKARFTTALLEADEWPHVRAFWRDACGDVLPVEAHDDQQVVGLFDEDGTLVGANIQLRFDDNAYSAFTLVHRKVRHLGGGRQMIEHAIREAKARGVEMIYVHIHVRNLPSIKAYRRVGFVRRRWWKDESDPLLAAERQWHVYELRFAPRSKKRVIDL